MTTTTNNTGACTGTGSSTSANTKRDATENTSATPKATSAGTIRRAPARRNGGSRASGSAASHVRPLLDGLFPRGLPVRFVFWDGSELGPADGPGVIRLRSPKAVSRILWAPNELGIARAFVAGDLDAEGDAYETLRLLNAAGNGDFRGNLRLVRNALRAANGLGVLGLPPTPPAEESRLTGWRHSKDRDRRAVTHHYDVGNDFYRLVLGPTMTYSCARFAGADVSLEDAQTAKHELVCRKLGIGELRHRADGPARLLDVGCGWGSMALHAATEYGTKVVGITLSPSQARLARRRVADAGLEASVEIRLLDYRDLGGETFDAISSVGMFEHVGHEHAPEYFGTMRRLLAPGGRLLNHAISSVGGSKLGNRSFVGRYVFPDGELIDVGDVVRLMEEAGFEVRDVESLREHYSMTLHAWVKNLEDHWTEAEALAGTPRTRVWWLYMSVSANGFDDGGLSVHQVLGVVPGPRGESGMPMTRAGW
jgi:cyclopropane-fatty-acyl-phospholipid synthase